MHKDQSGHQCAQCPSRVLCWPAGLDAPAWDDVERAVLKRLKVKRGDTLVHHGERFQNIYAVRSGFFKATVASSDGREQVTGFHMSGEFMGMDGVVHEQHTCDAVALEDSEVCVLPFERIEAMSRHSVAMQRHVHKLMSQEIVRERSVLVLLGASRADERMATVLLNLTQRLHARGFSASELVLRMSREELGSYLCIKLETVSRTFSKFAAEGILEVKQRHIRILDVDALQALVYPTAQRAPTPTSAPKSLAWAKPGGTAPWGLARAWMPQPTPAF